MKTVRSLLLFLVVVASIGGALWYSNAHKDDAGIDSFAALAQALLSALALFVLAYDLHSQGKTIAEQQEQLQKLASATAALVRVQGPFLRLELSDDAQHRVFFRLANRGGGPAFLHALKFELNGTSGSDVVQVLEEAARHIEWVHYEVVGRNHAADSIPPGKTWEALAILVPPQLAEGRERQARVEFINLIQLMQVRVTLSGIAEAEAIVIAEPTWIHPQRPL